MAYNNRTDSAIRDASKDDRDRIFNILQRGPQTVEQISQRYGWTFQVTRNKLRHQIDAGRVRFVSIEGVRRYSLIGDENKFRPAPSREPREWRELNRDLMSHRRLAEMIRQPTMLTVRSWTPEDMQK